VKKDLTYRKSCGNIVKSAIFFARREGVMEMQNRVDINNRCVQPQIELRVCKENSDVCFVFVNGKFQDELSWDQALRRYADKF
jgi:hypothetical protein